MMNLEYYTLMYMYLISFGILCLFYKHLMCLIISLEFMFIILVLNLYSIMWVVEGLNFLILYLMIMGVCEGVLSLSLVILMVRFHGNDYINSLSMVKW